MLVLVIGGIYEVRRWDGFMGHDIHTKFYGYQLRCLEVFFFGGVKHTYTQRGDLKTLLLFFLNKEIRLKR
jgi:hypothetical protein